MQVEDGALKQSSSGLDFKLHPLVLINISDHFTRYKANSIGPDGGAAEGRVLGLLLGQQTGRIVDVSNSFELRYSLADGGAVALDTEFMLKKQEQYKQVFPKLDVVGWYSTGAELQDSDMNVHKKVTELNESPIMLLLDPKIQAARKDLPVKLYESELHVVDGTPQFIFVQAKYTVETSEAERIGVNQVAKILPSGKASGSDQLTAHLTASHSAIKMLNSRISLVLQLLDKMSRGEIPRDHALLRQISALVHRLPALDTPAFRSEYLTEYSDAMLTILLSTVTKGASNVNELTDKINLAYDRSTRRRGGFM